MSKHKRQSGKRVPQAPALQSKTSTSTTAGQLRRWVGRWWWLGGGFMVLGVLVVCYVNFGPNRQGTPPGKSSDYGSTSASSFTLSASAGDTKSGSGSQENLSPPKVRSPEGGDFYRPVEALKPAAPREATSLVSTNVTVEERVAQFMNQANDLRKNGQLREALELYRKAMELAPGNEEVHFNLAFVLAKTGATNEACAHYKQALEIFPEYCEAHNNLGNLLLAQGKFDEALEHFKTVIEISPDNEKGHNNLGIALSQKGRFREAAQEFTKVTRLNPDFLEARYNLVRAALRLQDTNAVEIQFSEILQRASEKGTAHLLLGTIAAQAGDLHRAETQFLEALKKKPDSIEGRFNLARVWLQLGQRDLAITALKEVLEAKPNFQPAEQLLRLIERASPGGQGRDSTNARSTPGVSAPATNPMPSGTTAK